MRRMTSILGLALVWALLSCAGAAGQLAQAPPFSAPDARYKADILVVVAHPDDETEIIGYLARAIYDEHKRVAVVFGTPGNSGGNAMGEEQAAALGDERKIEARRALESMGVMNVWFLRGTDTPGQNVLRSLETWNHGAALDEMARLVRLTRPEVILTWLPDYVVGENHGDHQAAGVIATEAFDLAGDPTQFPEQVSAPRDRLGVGNLTEGLRPWQPEKLYYFSDASDTHFMDGQGPVYSTKDISPSQHVSYARIAAREMSFHLTQGDTGQFAKKALETGNLDLFMQPVRFIFGKSVVGGTPTGGIFAGVQPGPVSFNKVPGYVPENHDGVWMELGGPWAFYKRFWRAHGLEHLASLLPTPEIGIGAGNTLFIPVVLHNPASSPAEVTLTVSAPQTWIAHGGAARYPIRGRGKYVLEVIEEIPPKTPHGWRTVSITTSSDGKPVGSITVKVNINSGGLPE